MMAWLLVRRSSPLKGSARRTTACRGSSTKGPCRLPGFLLLLGAAALLSDGLPGHGLQLKGCSRHGKPVPKQGRGLLERSYPPDTFNPPSLTPKLLDKLVRTWNATLKQWVCPVSTSDCGFATSPGHRPGSLGSCAVVGLGAGLRRHRYGSDIDRHDTVVRMGYVPIKAFSERVGTKTDVMFLKLPTYYVGDQLGTDRYSKKLPEHTPTKFYLTFPYSCTTGRFDDRDVLLVQLLPPQDYKACRTGFVSQQPWARENDSRVDSRFLARVAEGFYKPLKKYRRRNFVIQAKDEKSRSKEAYIRQIQFTTGFGLIASLLSSRLCTTMDVYGFSSVPSLKYFAARSGPRNHLPRPGHVLGLENYLLRVAQHLGLLCIYADR